MWLAVVYRYSKLELNNFELIIKFAGIWQPLPGGHRAGLTNLIFHNKTFTTWHTNNLQLIIDASKNRAIRNRNVDIQYRYIYYIK